jgi:chemotaxis protein methyltransferase CheR
LADRGEWVEALEGCERLLVEDRLNPEVYFVQGLILEQMPPHQGAEASFRRALYLSRNFVLAHYYLGLHQQKNGQTKGALQSFQNVLQLLASLPGEQVLRCGDGMLAKDLARLTTIHLHLLETR